MAITCEYLAYELGMHVLVIMTDITIMLKHYVKYQLLVKKFQDAGYPGYMYTDLASLMNVRDEFVVKKVQLLKFLF